MKLADQGIPELETEQGRDTYAIKCISMVHWQTSIVFMKHSWVVNINTDYVHFNC